MLHKPGVQFFQQLWPAGDVFQIEVQSAGIAVLRAQHIDNPLSAAFKADAVEFAVAGGFDIQRDPLQRWPVVGIGFQAGVDQAVSRRLAAKPDGRGDKALHQVALGRPYIRFIYHHAILTQQLFQLLQLAVLMTIESEHRTMAEIFQLKGNDTEMAFLLK